MTRRDVRASKLQRLDVTELVAGDHAAGTLIVGTVPRSPDGVERVQVIGLSGRGNLVMVGVEPDRLFPVYFYDGPDDAAPPSDPPGDVSPSHQ